MYLYLMSAILFLVFIALLYFWFLRKPKVALPVHRHKRLTLVLPPMSVQPGETAIASAEPLDCDFVPDDFVIPAHVAEHFLIEDLVISGKGQIFSAPASIPAVVFASSDRGFPLQLDIIRKGTKAEITVTNRSPEIQRFVAYFMGRKLS